MKAIVFSALALLSHVACAQQFENTFSVVLPDSAIQAQVEWVDLDNDGFLDAFVFATLQSGEHFLITYQNNSAANFIFKSAQLTGFSNGVYKLADTDGDNDIDIIVSGSNSGNGRTSFFENQSNFLFNENIVLDLRAGVLHFRDLDNDGKSELVLSGKNTGVAFLNIYEEKATWQVANDSLKIEVSSLEIFDADLDGDNDIFYSGEVTGNHVVSGLLSNQGKFYLKPVSVTNPAKGKTMLGDLNHDGNLDVFLAGSNPQGQNVFVRYLNNGGIFFGMDTLQQLSGVKAFIADFNSDGKCDIQISGKTHSGDTINTINLHGSQQAILNHKFLHNQTFGDYDHDGDLDVVQVVQKQNLFVLQVIRNKTVEVNEGPLKPSRALGFSVFDRLFLYWDKTTDDHTPQSSITYDVTLQLPNEEVITGEFDLINRKRLTVSSGNNGTRNFLLLHPEETSGFNYSVQAIDNSFHSGNASVCVGASATCQQQQIVDIPVCKNEIVHLTASADAQWFSLNKFLGSGSTYQQSITSSDTIFSFVPSEGCASLKIYLLNLKTNFLKSTTETKFVCDGEAITLNVEKNWEDVQWQSKLRGDLGTNSAVTYTFTQNDTVAVQATNSMGCSVQRKTALKISKPVIFLAGDVFQIVKGESVQLGAEGGSQYSWTPTATLDNPSSATPVASPLSSTDYSVTVKDSLGCQAQAAVRVLVEGSAFVPTLFTPNADGKNDEVRVYGVGNVSDFNFVIHNREGKVVYQSKDPGQVASVGWDGASNGVQQPAGVYFWKVKGVQGSGRKLILNGKDSGSIVLIR
jgi:gliding motility-associated-like protein